MSARIKKTRVRVLFLFFCGFCGATLADDAAKKVLVNDQDNKSGASEPTLEVEYSSVFDNYVPFDHIPEIGWKEANDNVGEIGGWRAYLELVQEQIKIQADANKSDQKETEKESDEQEEGDKQ